MKISKHKTSEKLVFSLLLTLLALLFGPSKCLALTPPSLVIVYNQNMAESKAVAQYYAEKRCVPLANLIGVDVTTSEKMLRSDFEERLVPPVKTICKRLQDENKDPAVLLVYGIPLRVGGLASDESERAFLALLKGKVKEYQDLVVQLIGEIDQYVLENGTEKTLPTPSKKVHETKDLLKAARESFERGLQYLIKSKSKKSYEETTLRISSLLIRLAGTSMAARVFLEGMAEEKDLEFFRNQELLKWNIIMKTQLSEQSFRGTRPETALETATIVRFTHGVVGELKFWDDLKDAYENSNSSASVDSELTLMMAGPCQLTRWLPNPFHERYDGLPFIKRIRYKTIKVGRLDGPTPELAKRLVDDAVAIENKGLKGIFYIDARGLSNEGAHGSYAWYDRHLLNLYNILHEDSSIEVRIDQAPKLFAEGACPDAALYCGWYSLRNYVPSFTWQKGAVAFHVASAEASTLRNKDSNAWCKRMIEEGVAATLGPVEEPYLLSFPLPDHFFPLLMSGKLPLLEVYFRTTPFVSWKQVLIGDPLYTPFKNNPAIQLPLKKRPESPRQEEETRDSGPARF